MNAQEAFQQVARYIVQNPDAVQQMEKECVKTVDTKFGRVAIVPHPLYEKSPYYATFHHSGYTFPFVTP